MNKVGNGGAPEATVDNRITGKITGHVVPKCKGGAADKKNLTFLEKRNTVLFPETGNLLFKWIGLSVYLGNKKNKCTQDKKPAE
jgi:hypothetical protein